MNILESISPNDIEKLATPLLKDQLGTLFLAIKDDHSKIYDVSREIFRRWIQGTGRKPVAAWKTLVEVFKDINLNHLASIIESTCPSDIIST